MSDIYMSTNYCVLRYEYNIRTEKLRLKWPESSFHNKNFAIYFIIVQHLHQIVIEDSWYAPYITNELPWDVHRDRIIFLRDYSHKSILSITLEVGDVYCSSDLEDNIHSEDNSDYEDSSDSGDDSESEDKSGFDIENMRIENSEKQSRNCLFWLGFVMLLNLFSLSLEMQKLLPTRNGMYVHSYHAYSCHQTYLNQDQLYRLSMMAIVAIPHPQPSSCM